MLNIRHIEAITSLVAKAHTIKEGIGLGSLLDHDSISIEFDAKLLVQSNHNLSHCPSYKVDHLISDIK